MCMHILGTTSDLRKILGVEITYLASYAEVGTLLDIMRSSKDLCTHGQRVITLHHSVYADGVCTHVEPSQYPHILYISLYPLPA